MKVTCTVLSESAELNKHLIYPPPNTNNMKQPAITARLAQLQPRPPFDHPSLR